MGFEPPMGSNPHCLERDLNCPAVRVVRKVCVPGMQIEVASQPFHFSRFGFGEKSNAVSLRQALRIRSGSQAAGPRANRSAEG